MYTKYIHSIFIFDNLIEQCVSSMVNRPSSKFQLPKLTEKVRLANNPYSNYFLILILEYYLILYHHYIFKTTYDTSQTHCSTAVLYNDLYWLSVKLHKSSSSIGFIKKCLYLNVTLLHLALLCHAFPLPEMLKIQTKDFRVMEKYRIFVISQKFCSKAETRCQLKFHMLTVWL